MSVRTTIKSIQKTMRKDTGVDGDAQRIGQLCWMFFLKIIDDQDQELELVQPGYESPVPDEFKWRNWAADREGMTGDELVAFINGELFPKLKGLPITGPQSHSVDVILGGGGKRRVVDAMRRLADAPGASVLRIGDKGRWPGNDVDLLSDPLGLSVDEVSQDLESCWNFTPAGVLGPQATLYYVSRLSSDPQGRLLLKL